MTTTTEQRVPLDAADILAFAQYVMFSSSLTPLKAPVCFFQAASFTSACLSQVFSIATRGKKHVRLLHPPLLTFTKRTYYLDLFSGSIMTAASPE